MTAVTPVSPDRSASPGSTGSQRNPMVSRVPASGPFARTVTRAAVADALSAIAGVRAASLAPGTLTTARNAMPAGTTQVHHG